MHAAGLTPSSLLMDLWCVARSQHYFGGALADHGIVCPSFIRFSKAEGVPGDAKSCDKRVPKVVTPRDDLSCFRLIQESPPSFKDCEIDNFISPMPPVRTIPGRASKACDTCRSRKTRCYESGESSMACLRCSTLHLECSFQRFGDARLEASDQHICAGVEMR